MKKRIAIFGAGGCGREVLVLLHQINEANPVWDFIGFYDDGLPVGTSVNGYPLLGGVAAVNAEAQPLALVVAIAQPATKEKVVSQLTNPKLHYATLIHPEAIPRSYQFIELGEGTVVGAGNRLTANIQIGRHVFLHSSCTVGHDTVIEDFCSLMPSVNVSGEVRLEKGVYCGTGAAISNQIAVGEGTIIGAGAAVVRSLPAHCTAVGVPAKPIKFHPIHE